MAAGNLTSTCSEYSIYAKFKFCLIAAFNHDNGAISYHVFPIFNMNKVYTISAICS